MAIVFFDVDHTLIPKTSAEAIFIRWLLLHGKISIINILHSVEFFFHHIDAIASTAFRGNKMYLRGMKRKDIEQYGEHIFSMHAQRYIAPKGRETIARLRQEGNKVVLLSASPSFLIRHIQSFVKADDIIATEFEFVNDAATGFITDDKHPYGEQKVRFAKEYAKKLGMSLQECSAYANAFSDLPLLRAVGNPVAINPDRRLARWAKNSRWQIQYFRV